MTTMAKQYVYRANRVRVLKEGVDLKEYLAKHPDAYAIDSLPNTETLADWASDSGCEALDGCRVKPDGTCPHGKPSWLMALGYI